jgi:Protein of unknwon function (DUF3310)
MHTNPERSVSPHDAVEHPKHYTFGKFEVIDVLMDWFAKSPLLWQVGKYIARADHKGNAIEDLKKARWYLDREIAQREADANRVVTILDNEPA